MVNTMKLKGRIVEKNTTIGKLAKKVGYSAYYLGRMISNKAEMPLKVSSILKQELDITNEELTDFFYV